MSGDATDRPPAKAPSYFSGGWFRLGSDEPQFRVKEGGGWEFLNPGQDDDPVLAAAAYAEDFVRAIAHEPRWIATGGWEILPGQLSAKGGAHRVAFKATKASGETVSGDVAFAPDASNWVRVEVFIGPFRVFLAYFDRVWEEFDLWPSGSTGDGEAPGRVGKRKNWVNLSAAAWPQLRRAGGEDYFAVELPDS